jgi:hypothetical protein
MLIILNIQEAEIRRISVQPRQIVRETQSQKTPPQNKTKKKGLVEWLKM